MHGAERPLSNMDKFRMSLIAQDARELIDDADAVVDKAEAVAKETRELLNSARNTREYVRLVLDMGNKPAEETAGDTEPAEVQ